MDNFQNPEEPMFLVVCSYCKKTFDKSTQIELISGSENKDAVYSITHGACPDCLLQHFPKEYLRIQEDSRMRIKNEFRRKYREVDANQIN